MPTTVEAINAPNYLGAISIALIVMPNGQALGAER
jgi:hypothetical protein